MICPNCNVHFDSSHKFCDRCGTPLQAEAAAPAPTSSQSINFDFSAPTATATAVKSAAKYEYKVLTQKDKWFSGKFDPAILEQAINAYAQQGWRVIGCATADIPGFGTTRQEFVTLLEREV